MADTKPTDSCSKILYSLTWCEGQSNLPGLRRRAWCINRSDIVSAPELLRLNGSVTQAIVTGDITLKEGDTFAVYDFIPAKSTASSQSQGEYPSQTQLVTVELFHPGVGHDASLAAAALQNRDLVWIIQDASGNARIVGFDSAYPTKTEVSMDFGQGPTGEQGTKIKITATERVAFPIFIGCIKTKTGDVEFTDCDSEAIMMF